MEYKSRKTDGMKGGRGRIEVKEDKWCGKRQRGKCKSRKKDSKLWAEQK